MPYNLTTMQSIYHNQDEIVEITYNNSSVYHKSSGPDYTEPFYVENISNTQETLNIVKNSSSAPTLTIEYSTDKTTWNTFGTTSTTALTRTLAPGEKVYLRCSAEKWVSSSQSNKITGVSKVGGNTMSLLYGSNFTGEETSFPSGSNYNFGGLFTNNTRLIDASNLLLPATTLTANCYQYMFYHCTALTSAPALPATTLADYCYQYMFSYCTSLTAAPALPATTLAQSCYSNMFSYCTSLTSAPALPATTLANGCYSIMFQNCTSLTTAPALPATTLAGRCYEYMFIDCTQLTNVACYATSRINKNYSTSDWLSGVSSTGTFTKAAGVEWPTGTSGIPSGWTVIEV